MSGFSGYIVKSVEVQEKLANFEFKSTQNELFPLQSIVSMPNFRLAWYSNSKFKNDKGLIKDSQSVFGFDGINLNEDTSKESWLTNEMLKQVESAVENHTLGNWASKLKGSFQACHYNCQTQRLILLTDHTGSKPFFYFENEFVFVFSSSIFFIQELINYLGLNSNLDIVGAYQFVTFGYLLGSQTLVQEIKKLEPGKLLSVSSQSKISIGTYFSYQNEVQIKRLTPEVFEELDALFVRSLKLEYNKDLQYNYQHLAHLSGGLDSRLNVMIANKLGYSNQTNLTFGQDQSSDELIARTITNQLGHLHIILKLGDGSYLTQSQLPLVLNNCSVYYYGAAQTLLANQQLNFNRFGLNHNGILAESSKGGYLKYGYYEPVHAERWGVSTKLTNRIQSEIDSMALSANHNDELFALYNRGFNAIHNGTWMTEPFSSSVYTYMEPEFANFAFSIDPKFRVNGNLTIDWMNLKHPVINKFPWKYGALPTSNPNKLLMARIQNRVKLTFGKKDGVAVPIQEWFTQNPKLIQLLQFKYNFEAIGNKQLQNDLQQLANTGTIHEQLLVFNFFNAFKLLFPERQ